MRELDIVTPPNFFKPISGDTHHKIDATSPRHRVVNLLLGPERQPRPMDVWVQASETTSAVQLASGIAFGEVSPWFAAPADRTTVLVDAGANPTRSI